MKTLLEIIRLSTDHLNRLGIPSPRREAEELIADCLNLKRIDLYIQYNYPLNEDELEKCRDSIKRRCKGEPSQYIRGFVDFFNCKILVNPNVLIPRHETEILVDIISKKLEKEASLQDKVLWDICCGSGCIGISLKKKFPELSVTLSDISKEALLVAKENAAINNTDVNFLLGNLFEPYGDRKADYIVSNPPYIAESEFQSLQKEVAQFEPKLALISGSTGLEFYEYFAKHIRKYLQPHGKAWFEIGAGQGNALIDLFKFNKFDTISVEKDWSQHDRFFSLEIE